MSATAARVEHPYGEPEAAVPPGLRWVSDTEPGIGRRRRGSSFSYHAADGKAIDDPAMLKRIRSLVIPPAWADVWICQRANGHLQATGRDARGRKQYLYHPMWHAHRGLTKFEHMLEFGLALPRIRKRVRQQLSGKLEPSRNIVLATLVHLLDTTWLRIGNDEYARSNGSYGLSTLRRRHVEIVGSELTLSFRGKSGVPHQVVLSDRRLARVIRRCRDLPGQELFTYLGEDGNVRRIASDDVNAWLAEATGRNITAKDFRTWHGSVQALDLAVAACSARRDGRNHEGPASCAKLVAEVARRLGNTPAVCRKSYVHPAVLDIAALLDAAVAPDDDPFNCRWLKTPPRIAGLRISERRLLGLLEPQRLPKAVARAGRAIAVVKPVRSRPRADPPERSPRTSSRTRPSFATTE